VSHVDHIHLACRFVAAVEADLRPVRVPARVQAEVEQDYQVSVPALQQVASGGADSRGRRVRKPLFHYYMGFHRSVKYDLFVELFSNLP